MALFKKKNVSKFAYDPALHTPVIYSSICTGEKRAGFEVKSTGKFEEVMCIRTPEDMKMYLKTYGLSEKDILVKY